MSLQPQYFVNGSILRHILSMAHTSMLALVAMVLVDALDLFFLSLLGDVDVVAGLGFAWPLIFFTLAVSLGISTAMTALVSRAEGQGNPGTCTRSCNSHPCLRAWYFCPYDNCFVVGCAAHADPFGGGWPCACIGYQLFANRDAVSAGTGA